MANISGFLFFFKVVFDRASVQVSLSLLCLWLFFFHIHILPELLWVKFSVICYILFLTLWHVSCTSAQIIFQSTIEPVLFCIRVVSLPEFLLCLIFFFICALISTVRGYLFFIMQPSFIFLSCIYFSISFCILQICCVTVNFHHLFFIQLMLLVNTFLICS